MSELANKFKAMGNTCMKNQDFVTAITHYKQGLGIDPDNPILNCNLSQAHLNLKEYAEAESYAKKAIEHQEDYTKAYFRAAKAALGRHNLYEAMLYLAQGVQNCSGENIEELYSMAKELSSEFETNLRTFRNLKKPEVKASTSVENNGKVKSVTKTKKGKLESKKQNPELVKEEIPTKEKVKAVKNSGKGELESKKKNSSLVGAKEEIQNDQASLDAMKTENEVLKSELSKQKEVVEHLQKKLKGAEDKHKKVASITNGLEKKGQEKCGKDRTELERKKLEKKEQEKKQREKEEHERKELEKHTEQEKEQERREAERKERERKEQEKKEQERKEHEMKEHERKEREHREREKKEREKLNQLEKERKLHLEREAERKKKEEELKIKAEEEKNMSLKIDVHNFMKEGSVALLKGLNRKAIDSLKKAQDVILSHPPPESLGFSNPMELVVLQFAFCQALIQSDEYNDIVRAINILDKLEKEGKHSKLPAIFLLLGRAYLRLNRFKNAQPPIERGLSLLNRGAAFSRYSWPGTYDVIDLTDRHILKDALVQDLQLSKLYHKPDAICFHEKCLQNSQHISPSRCIFYNDPDFIGYVALLCQENCHIYFHIPCWKDYKENLSEIGKLGEKDFLGRPCLTPDCKNAHNLPLLPCIIKVSIIGPDGEEKSSCEHIPPSPSPSLFNKEHETIYKSPKKKQRKKESDKSEHSGFKRIRQNSRNHGDTDPIPNQDNLQRSHFNDALSKLATARENNFGYDCKASDPFNITSFPSPPQLGKNEEFVYSYFLEIFKKEGYMSVFKLQEHWEANKELLPVLQPALITHTDLVKFLLDTEGFAVVHDMIGIASELPTISAIVESKAEAPPQVVYGWQPSSATALEASKTLSFTSSIASNSGTFKEDLVFNPRDDSHCFKNDYKPGICDNIPHEEISFYGNGSFKNDPRLLSEVEESKCEFNVFKTSEVHCNSLKPIISSDVSAVKSSSRFVTITNDLEKPMSSEVKKYIGVSDSTEKLSSSIVIQKKYGTNGENLEKSFSLEVKKCEDGSDSTEILRSSIAIEKRDGTNEGKHQDVSGEIKPALHIPSFSGPCSKQQKSAEDFGVINSSFIVNSSALLSAETPRELGLSSGDASLSAFNGHTAPLINGEKSEQVQTFDPLIQKKTNWKPRAKLMEWATETFPGQSMSTLWEALTHVRTNNNYTLSGLSFDVIAERVSSVLQMNGGYS